MNLKESKECHMEEFGGMKETGETDIIIISKDERNNKRKTSDLE